MMTKIFLVIPCHNPTAAQWQNLDEYLQKFRDSVSAQVDVLVVDDGSNQWIEPPAKFQFRIHREKLNRGKGGVIRLGIDLMPSDSNIFAFTDFDVPFSIENLVGVCAGINGGAQVCIGDRSMVSNRLSRHFSHGLFKLFVRTIVIGGLFDTQAGIKALNAQAARIISRLSVLNGFLFDIEWLYIAARHRLTIQTWPVKIIGAHESSSLRSFLKLKLFTEFFKLLKKIAWREYNSPELLDWAQAERDQALSKLVSKKNI